MSTKKMFSTYPQAKYWHPTKNGKLTPDMVSYGSAKKCWFICEVCKHDFESDPNHITALVNPTWCPYCANKILCMDNDCKICFEKSFASYKKPSTCTWNWSNANIDKKTNCYISPRDVFLTSNKNFLFNCTFCMHQYDAQICNIALRNDGCPFCSSVRLCEKIDCIPCLEKSFESHERSKYWDNLENRNIRPRDVFKNSHKKFWFICEQGHSFYASLGHVSSVTEPRWCSYCNGTSAKVLEQCPEKSLSSHPISEFWDKEQNGELTPASTFIGSSQRAWFNCNCGHSFDSIISNLTRNNPSGCPYCASPPKRLCENNADRHCLACFEKSFASHEKSALWEYDLNKSHPSQIFKGDNDEYWFKCNTCNHTFEQRINTITHLGSGCPYCTSKILCEDDECKLCFEKSFASHPRASFFSKKNGDIVPRNIFKCTGNNYWFDCEKGHVFKASPNHIASRNGRPGSWCPHCVHKTEEMLYNALLKYYPTIERQFRVEWCKKKNYLPFDNAIPEYKIIIELDGPQHFRQIYKGGRTPDEERDNDLYKMNCANENGYSVIRILQMDVYYNTYDWLQELKDSIQSIIEEGTIQNIFLCMNGEYDSY